MSEAIDPRLTQVLEKPNNGLLSVAVDKAMTDKLIHDAKFRRGHLGLSTIGDPDERTLWMRFRWVLPQNSNPRTARIWQMGHATEELLIKWIKLVPGVMLNDVDPVTNDQYRVSYVGGHVGGSCDGIIIGAPEVPNGEPAIWEAKSMAAKYWDECRQKGVKKSNPTYYWQMQMYRHAFGLGHAVFTAANKNDQQILTEYVPPCEDHLIADLHVKARRIVESVEAPASTYPNRDYYKSKFMSEEDRAVYWGDRLPAEVNCRNCRFSVPLTDDSRSDAAWHCTLHQKEIPLPTQVVGCRQHNWLPSVMPEGTQLVALHDAHATAEYRTKDGRQFFNAHEDARGTGVYSSQELSHLSAVGLDETTLGDAFADKIRQTFDAKVISAERVYEPGTDGAPEVMTDEQVRANVAAGPSIDDDDIPF